MLASIDLTRQPERLLAGVRTCAGAGSSLTLVHVTSDALPPPAGAHEGYAREVLHDLAVRARRRWANVEPVLARARLRRIIEEARKAQSI
jgi:hypothetical protein